MVDREGLGNLGEAEELEAVQPLGSALVVVGLGSPVTIEESMSPVRPSWVRPALFPRLNS